MTPFDPIALLAMLLTFYPVVGVGALRRARQERPEYFAAGELYGSKGEKLRLPDGRKFDLIYATGSPVQRWQVLDITFEQPGTGVADPFAYEPGGLEPIDTTLYPPPAPKPVFVPLVAARLQELGASEALLGGASSRMAEQSSSAGLEAAYQALVAPAAQQLAGQTAALRASIPDDVVAQSNGQATGATRAQGAYEEPAPPQREPPSVPPQPREPFPRPEPPAPQI